VTYALRGRTLALTSVLVLLATMLVGCTTSVSGTVTSHTTQEPLAGVVVEIEGVSMTTTADGGFSLDVALESEQTTLTVRRAGFPDHRVVITKGDGHLDIEFPDAIVKVRVMENAVESAAVSTCNVTALGLQLQESDSDQQAFVSELVPVGTTRLEVASPGHEDWSIEATLSPGVSSFVATLSLTAEETYRRYVDAYTFWRLETAYEYLHPDLRAVETFEEYKTGIESGGQVKSVKIEGSRELAEWTCRGKTYTGVVEIDRMLELQDDWGDYTASGTQHWAKHEGRWYAMWEEAD